MTHRQASRVPRRSATLWSHQDTTLRAVGGCLMNILHSSVRREDYAYDEYADSEHGGELHFSPGLAPAEQEYGSQLRYERRFDSARRPFRKELLRLLFWGVVIVAIPAAALAVRYGEPRTVQTLRTIKRTVNRLSTELGIKPSVPGAPRQASLANLSHTQEGPVVDAKPALPAVSAADHVQRQLDKIASDVANVKGLVEQLSGSQKQMATQLVALKAVNDSFTERTWWLTQAAAFSAPPGKSQHKIARNSPAPVTIARP
jgi:hypothetical protein